MTTPTPPPGPPPSPAPGPPSGRAPGAIRWPLHRGPSASRKDLERAEREQLFLDVARELLLERGYLGLTMDRIAECTPFSKGTVYQHFPNKEDVLAALNQRTSRIHLELFQRAATFRGRPRERMCAVGMAHDLWMRTYPDDVAACQIVRHASIGAKISAERAKELERMEDGCFAICEGIVRDGVASGDLKLERGDPRQVGHGLWALAQGAYQLQAMDFELHKLGVPDDVGPLVIRHQHALLDGYGWRPLFDEWDWERTYVRIGEELFAEELEHLHRD
jgi:AcrR family transcriptional regulator